jgi:hypothetical protein
MRTEGIQTSTPSALQLATDARFNAIGNRLAQFSAKEARLTQVQAFGNGNAAAAGAAPQRASDPVVDQRVRETIEFTQFSRASDPAYIISQTLADTSLTQAQKDEYIARLVEISRLDNHITLEGQHVTSEDTGKLRTAFEEIGDAWTGNNTPELMTQVRDSIARSADSGRLSATDLHGLFNTQNGGSADGIRTLLSTISDGDTLNSLSGMLLADARRAGLSEPYSTGGALLVAAGDIANMAAAHGRTSAANAVALEIRSQTKNMSSKDANKYVETLILNADGEWFGGPQPGRAAFEVLSTLVNSTSLNSENGRQAVDSLFASLVRSDFERFQGREAGMSQLGEYFDNNLRRMLQNDWRADGPNSGKCDAGSGL